MMKFWAVLVVVIAMAFVPVLGTAQTKQAPLFYISEGLTPPPPPPTPRPTPPPSVMVVGTVYDMAGSPVQWANIQLSRFDGSCKCRYSYAWAGSEADGSFSLKYTGGNVLPQGEYLVEIDSPSHLVYRQTIYYLGYEIWLGTIYLGPLQEFEVVYSERFDRSTGAHSIQWAVRMYGPRPRFHYPVTATTIVNGPKVTKAWGQSSYHQQVSFQGEAVRLGEEVSLDGLPKGGYVYGYVTINFRDNRNVVVSVTKTFQVNPGVRGSFKLLTW